MGSLQAVPFRRICVLRYILAAVAYGVEATILALFLSALFFLTPLTSESTIAPYVAGELKAP